MKLNLISLGSNQDIIVTNILTSLSMHTNNKAKQVSIRYTTYTKKGGSPPKAKKNEVQGFSTREGFMKESKILYSGSISGFSMLLTQYNRYCCQAS